jgi:hypothetical protein
MKNTVIALLNSHFPELKEVTAEPIIELGKRSNTQFLVTGKLLDKLVADIVLLSDSNSQTPKLIMQHFKTLKENVNKVFIL